MAHVSTLRLEPWRIGRLQGALTELPARARLRQRRSLDAIGMSRAALGRFRRATELNRFSWKAPG
jgi:hypothetical protein